MGILEQLASHLYSSQEFTSSRVNTPPNARVGSAIGGSDFAVALSLVSDPERIDQALFWSKYCSDPRQTKKLMNRVREEIRKEIHSYDEATEITLIAVACFIHNKPVRAPELKGLKLDVINRTISWLKACENELERKVRQLL